MATYLFHINKYYNSGYANKNKNLAYKYSTNNYGVNE